MAKKIQTVQVKVRMTRDLQRRIQREADRQGQTINAEILVRLEQSFKILERISAVTRQLQEVADAVIKATESDEKNAQLVSEMLSGLPPDMALRVIEDAAKKLKPEDKGNDETR